MQDFDDLFGIEEVTEKIAVKDDKALFNSLLTTTSSADGNRAVLATRDLKAGTLVAFEWPFVTWSRLDFQEPSTVYEVLRSIYEHQLANQRSQELYPQQLSEKLIQEEIEPLTKSVLNLHDLLSLNLASNHIIPTDELYRLLLVLKHNAFDSGLYLYLSMFNHSCCPNCIKFSPSSKSRGASEIWTLREVQAGEELFISYYHPVEDKIATIRAYLSQQHHFTCHCPRCLSTAHSSNTATDDSFSSLMDQFYEEIESVLSYLAELSAQQAEPNTLYVHANAEDEPLPHLQRHIHRLYSHLLSLLTNKALQDEREGKCLSQYVAQCLVQVAAQYNTLFFSPLQSSSDFSALLQVHVRWIASSFYLIEQKSRGKDEEHPDNISHCQDVLQSFDLLLGLCKEHHLPVNEYLKGLTDSLIALQLDFDGITAIEKPSNAIINTLTCSGIKNWQETFPIVYNLYLYCLQEKLRLENLYHLVKRYPDVAYVKKEPGQLYLGKS